MSQLPLLVVVSNRGDVPRIEGIEIVTADDFLSGYAEGTRRQRTIVNLCRSLRYMSKGYYVSLLADARGQRVLPELDTIRGLADPYVLFRSLQEARVPCVDVFEMRDRRRALPKTILTSEETASDRGNGATALLRAWKDGVPVYRPAGSSELVEALAFFGQTQDSRFRRHAATIYREWPAPILRLQLLREDDEWKVTQVNVEAVHRLGEAARGELVRELAVARFLGRWWTQESEEVRASIAVLYDDTDPQSPSTPETIEKLQRIAARRNVHVHTIDPRELSSLSDYDALFIRTFTSLEEPAFQFAQRAEALGMPVVDDVESIIRCSNKVFLHELLSREGVPTPRTAVVAARTRFEDLERLGSPFVLKLPDGSFSSSVYKIAAALDFARIREELHRDSPLLIAQEFLPTEFDWRVTILDGRVLFVAKYFMAAHHWQIQTGTGERVRYGRVEAVRREYAPRDVVQTATRAAALIGEGLYGVDLKETRRGIVVIEINDNPNLEVGYEDTEDGDRIYEEIVDFFLRKVEGKAETREPREKRRRRNHRDPEIDKLRRPIGRTPPLPATRRAYRVFEVCGLEIEYPIVNRDLNAVPLVEDVFRTLHGQPTSEVDLGMVGFSNEIVDHLLEVKTLYPTQTLSRSEELLVEGIRRISICLRNAHARLLPTGMHPWLRPDRTGLWKRAGHRIYETYERIFETRTHGWRNVQSTHVNLPFGREEETVAMHNATCLLLPYLPAIAASSPLVDGDFGPDVDNRLTFVRTLQNRIPESMGEFLPEYVKNLREYREEILRPMYAAVDRVPGAEALRAEFLNARAAILRFDREALEVRILDTQECVRMDVAVAVFVRSVLRHFTEELLSGRIELPDRSVLLEDLGATIHLGSQAEVRAPHLGREPQPVRTVLHELLVMAREACRKEDMAYLDLVGHVIENGSLSERIRQALEPHGDDDQEFTEAARRLYIELADCLDDNRWWKGRGF